jgi:Protein of unknown function (DUF4236)
VPFRFRRSISIAPGVRLNIGKRGVSTSLGGHGAWGARRCRPRPDQDNGRRARQRPQLHHDHDAPTLAARDMGRAAVRRCDRAGSAVVVRVAVRGALTTGACV